MPQPLAVQPEWEQSIPVLVCRVSGLHPCMMVSLQRVSCPLPNPGSEAAVCLTSVGQATKG